MTTEASNEQDNTTVDSQGAGDTVIDEKSEGGQNLASSTEEEEKTPESTEESEEGKQEDDALKELFGKPETYDYKDVMPEGMQLNQEATDKFNIIADKLNLSQKGASELMTLAVELTQQTQAKIENAYVQAFETRKTQLQESLMNDKEIGGAKLDETLRVANLAFEKYAVQEVQNILAEVGLNSHPKLVKMFYEIGKEIQDDTIHGTGSPSSVELTREKLFYPHL